ncbi:squalene/phytoene synthase family protein [Sphingomonas palmae]|uniref:squalene/phytoene synthase family protein n=1 Tax=Sphingomonas palmae TaxID=1855283 RepID=UPI0015A52390|nr:squalene/phytoene synthase family protein [Sphingomonas palmae]
MSGSQSLSSPSRVFAWCGARFVGTGVDTLFALDRQLGNIVRTTEQPIVGQMRLTWWYEALEKLDHAPPPAQPLLQALAGHIGKGRVAGRDLAMMTEGWEALLDHERANADMLTQFAHLRGATLFRAAAALLGEDDPQVAQAGALWAFADLAANVSQDAIRQQAITAALDLADPVFRARWHGARPFGALAVDAYMAAAGRGVADGPRRAARVVQFRMIGR